MVDVKKLVYLHGALCEVLRLFPPIPLERKQPIKDDILPSGHLVDSSTKIIFSFYAMGRSEEIWEKDCLEFKPERWISEKGEIVHIPSYKFISFNAGPRTCLGKDMSFVQMKMVASAILRYYCVQMVEDHPQVIPSLSITLLMKYGLKKYFSDALPRHVHICEIFGGPADGQCGLMGMLSLNDPWMAAEAIA
ncbi:hypothetical protein PIB30_036585 [Stylosanthes scabra]|uniref:Cytochrome P450 n=1 Tax=Stylosanthes scabra TaxID=79078 RepID=A0ABU6YE51_9FABA|nr:hypothetical protein [Stylosanthes scabra]